MEVFAEYLEQIKNPQHRARAAEVLDWMGRTFPRWSPESHGISPCSPTTAHSSSASVCPPSIWPFRIPWDKEVVYPLLHRIIAFNRAEKAHCKTFWRNQA